MTKRLTSEKEMRFLCLAYFMSYLTRLNYAACMVELQHVLGIGKNVAGLPVTLCFLSYGIGQLVCGFLGDRFSPHKMIFTGLAGASACNLAIALFPGMGVIAPVWCLNGFFQSMLWPPMVRIMAEMQNDKWYRLSCVMVSMASSAATIVIYVMAPVCISLSSWKAVFVISAVLGTAAAFFWILRTVGPGGLAESGKGQPGGGLAEAGKMQKIGGTEEAEKEQACGIAAESGKEQPGGGLAEAGKMQKIGGTEEAEKEQACGTPGEAWEKPCPQEEPAGPAVKVSFRQLFAEAPLLLILLAIVLMGTLRDGITTWMPVYMSETFGMSNSSSILSAAALPVFAVFSTLFASFLLSRIKSEVSTAALLFGTGALAGGSMLMAFDSAPAVCILMMTLITGCMHGVNLMLISRVPGHFTSFGKVSTVSGVLNAATYVGSSLSTYGFGAAAENSGWKTVVALWIAIGILGLASMLSARGKWGRFCGKA